MWTLESFIHFPKAKKCEPYENFTPESSKSHALNEEDTRHKI